MKITLDLTDTAWEVDYQAILQSIEKVTGAEAGREPVTPEKMALHLFKLGIQAYKKELSEGGLGYGDIVSRTKTVELISGMTQRLIQHYQKHNALAELLRTEIKDRQGAFEAVKEALAEVGRKRGEKTVKLFQQEIFLTGIASVFPEIDEILGGPKIEIPRPAAAAPWDKKPKAKKPGRGGKR